MRHFADRLVEAIQAKGTAACVGLDPVHARLPGEVKDRHAGTSAECAAIVDYGKRILSRVGPLVPVVKLNIAFFEPYRGAGVDAYFELIDAARDCGLLVIGDVKRGDIDHSSARYAEAHLAADGAPDAVTVSPYLGVDGVRPFLDVARQCGKGVFVLVHTSNESAPQVQHLSTQDGFMVAGRVAQLVDQWANEDGLRGASGYSSVGAVVAPGDVDRARLLRSLMPHSIFLVPGFGAQGRSVAQVAACFQGNRVGAIVNSSRGIIYAHEQPRYLDACGGDWERCVEAACRDFVAALEQIDT